MDVVTEVRHLIGGDWSGAPSEERYNPADPQDLVTVTAVGQAAEVRQAIDAAVAAQRGWAVTPAPARGEVLLRASEIMASRSEKIARDLTREEGKTLAESRGEVRRAIDLLRFFGGEGWRAGGQVVPSMTTGTTLYTKREPLGVVGIITPWNFPIGIPTWKSAPALVCGNAVVMKPASLTTASATHLAQCLMEAGLPAGILNIVHGSGGVIGEAIVNDDRVAAISFTGSVGVGKHIYGMAADRMARIQLEMGGKNPLVVLDDADPSAAARIAAVGGFSLTGQACTATSRVIVTPGIADAFTAALVREAEQFTLGNGLNEDVRMGPVVSESQRRTDDHYLRAGQEDGAELLTGGQGDGLSLSAAVLRGVQSDHRVAQEEIFGPVIGIIEVSDFDEAIDVANGVEFGLSAGICTNDLEKAHVFTDRIQAGVVKVNRPTSGLELNIPFGGVKSSSTNTFREQGQSAVDFYSWQKSVYLGYSS